MQKRAHYFVKLQAGNSFSGLETVPLRRQFPLERKRGAASTAQAFSEAAAAVTANRAPRTSSPQSSPPVGRRRGQAGEAARVPRRVGARAASSGRHLRSPASAVPHGQGARSGPWGSIALPHARLSLPWPRSAPRGELLTLPSAIRQASCPDGTSEVALHEHPCFLQQFHSFITRPLLTAASRAGGNAGVFFIKLRNKDSAID